MDNTSDAKPKRCGFCHPSEVGKMSSSLLVSCVGGETCLGLCPIAQDCLGSTNALHGVWSQWWMDGHPKWTILLVFCLFFGWPPQMCMHAEHSGADYVILKVTYYSLSIL